MADISVDNGQILTHGEPPLKIKISKIGLRHVLSWPKLYDPGTFGGFGNW